MIKTYGLLIVSLALYLTLALIGIRYGLPDQGHILSYNCDETIWIEALGHLTPERHYNPNPELVAPSFSLLPMAAAIWVADKTGWIGTPQKAYFRELPNQFARIYILGRLVQTAGGVFLLLALWLCARRVFGLACANMACLLAAVTPGIVAASHFLQCNLMVTGVTMGAMGCFLVFESEPPGERRFLWWGSYLSGLALATKFSAAPLLVVMVYEIWRGGRTWKTLMSCGLLYGAGFVTGEPFILLSLSKFLASSNMLTGYVVRQIPRGKTGGPMWLWGFQTGLPRALGGIQWIAFLAGLAWLAISRRSHGLTLILSTLALFALSIATVGFAATPGRVLIIAPLITLVIARLLSQEWEQGSTVVRLLVMTLFVAITGVTATYGAIVAAVHHRTPIQKLSTEWLIQNVPTNKKIGVPRTPYHWSPDIILGSFYSPQRLLHPYAVENLSYSITQARKMDYVVASYQDAAWLRDDQGKIFLDWLAHSGDFELAQAFPRQLRLGPFRWKRPESPTDADDDLWVYSIFIYKRKLPAS